MMKETIGISLILIATFGFGFILYWFEKTYILKVQDAIGDKETEIQMQMNNFNFGIKPIITLTTHHLDTIYILKSLPTTQFAQHKIAELMNRRRILCTDYLIQIHFITNPKKVTPQLINELKKKWSNITPEEFEKERLEYDKNFLDMLNNLQTSKTNLKNKLLTYYRNRLWLLYFFVLCQVFGLLLTFNRC